MTELDGADRDSGADRYGRPPQASPPLLLTAKEAAAILRVSPTTLWRWRQQHRGPQWVDLLGQPRYKQLDVEQYIEDMVVR